MHKLIWAVTHSLHIGTFFICLSLFLSPCLCLSVSLFRCTCMSILLFVSCSWSSSLSYSPTYSPVCPSIHHQLMHYPVQLRLGPNLASRPYLCTVSCTWRLTVMQVLFFMRWLCCCLMFLALRGALAVDFTHVSCQCARCSKWIWLKHCKSGQCCSVKCPQ